MSFTEDVNGAPFGKFKNPVSRDFSLQTFTTQGAPPVSMTPVANGFFLTEGYFIFCWDPVEKQFTFIDWFLNWMFCKFAASVNDAGGQFTVGVVVTDSTSWVLYTVLYPGKFERNFEMTFRNYQRPRGRRFMKKTWSQKSRDTVSLNSPLKFHKWSTFLCFDTYAYTVTHNKCSFSDSIRDL